MTAAFWAQIVTIIIMIIIINMLMPVKSNSFTHLRVLGGTD